MRDMSTEEAAHTHTHTATSDAEDEVEYHCSMSQCSVVVVCCVEH